MIAASRSRQPLTAAYVRVSSPRRNGKSRQDTRSQKARIRQYADSQGFKRVRWYEDYQSGRTTRRDGLSDLLAACQRGKVGTILVADLSRLSRSVRDTLTLITELTAQGITLVCVNQNLTFDRSAMSQFMLTVFAALAELDSNVKSERIKAGLAVTDKKLGRPRNEAKRTRVRKLRHKGLTIRKIAAEMKMSKAGIYYLLAS